MVSLNTECNVHAVGTPMVLPVPISRNKVWGYVDVDLLTGWPHNVHVLHQASYSDQRLGLDYFDGYCPKAMKKFETEMLKRDIFTYSNASKTTLI